jgi:hypothetical protein
MLAAVRGAHVVVLVAGLVLTAVPSFAQGANPFVGVWELDRFKSVYDPIATAPEKRIMTLEGKGDQITSTTRTWRNAVANDVTYTAAFDEKDYPTAAAGTTVAFRRVNANTVERTAKLQGKVAETATWAVSDGGKTLTITTKGTDTAGTPYSSTQIYTKVK